MKEIRKLYNDSVNTESGIHPHLSTLKTYGESVDSITEFGASKGYATSAFLASHPQRLVSFDISYHPRIQKLVDASMVDDVDFWYILKDVREATIHQPTDILFINTKHNYNQRKQELAAFNHNVRKYIILHGTEKYKYENEIPEAGKRSGLLPAIEEFLQQHPDWEKHDESNKGNGLTILKRNG